MRLELGEEVDEDKERHGADWQGTKQPYQLALTPTMNAIRTGCHHALRMKDGFHHEVAAAVWSSKSPILGWFSTKQSCACMLGWVPTHKVKKCTTSMWNQEK